MVEKEKYIKKKKRQSIDYPFSNNDFICKNKFYI